VAVVLVVRMTIVQVVHVVLVDDGGVTAGRTVRVRVGLGRAVLGDGHFCSSEM
jgi:hypothetical protein